MQTRLRKDQAELEKDMLALAKDEREFRAAFEAQALERATARGTLMDKKAMRASALQRNMLSAAKSAKAPGGRGNTPEEKAQKAAARLLDDMKEEGNPMKGEVNEVIAGLDSIAEVELFKQEFARQLMRTYKEIHPSNLELTEEQQRSIGNKSTEEQVAEILQLKDIAGITADEIAFRRKNGWRTGESQFNEEQIRLINQGDVDAINDYALRQVEAMSELPAVQDERVAMLRERGVGSLDELVEQEFVVPRGLVQRGQASLEAGKGQLYRDSKSELMQVGAIQAGARRAGMTTSAYIDYMADDADARYAKTQAASPQSKAEAKSVDAITESAGTPGGVKLDIPLGGRSEDSLLSSTPKTGLQMDLETGSFASSAPSGGTPAMEIEDRRKNKVLDELRRLSVVPRGPISDLPSGGIKTFRGE